MITHIAPYYGGKFKMAKLIGTLFPKHSLYVEPFGGMANVLLQKKPAKIEVLNDLNGNIVALYRTLQNDYQALKERLNFTPYHFAEFRRAREILTENHHHHSMIDKAWAVVVGCYMGFASNLTKREGFSMGGPNYKSNTVKTFRNGIFGLDKVVERLRLVQFDQKRAIELCQYWDTEDALFYLDPPYVPSTRKDGGYQFEMTDVEHLELLEWCNLSKGRVVISGYPSTLYENNLRGWRRIEKQTFSNTNSFKDIKERIRTEVIWTNYTPDKQHKLF